MLIKYINKKLFNFSPKVTRVGSIKRYGTLYGGYDIYTKNLLNPIVISCGAGEDISFDIDLINNFNAKVILIDPTPRAIKHYTDLKKNFGVYSSSKYNESGKLKITNYNLKKISTRNLILEKKAIWDKNNLLIKLFLPIDKSNVSLSINKNNYSKDFITVKTTTIKKIIKKYSLKKIDILKLDIEGSEINVLNYVLKYKIPIKQIIIEYDFKKKPCLVSFFKLLFLHIKIINNRYFLCSINKKGDFLYLHKNL